ncbi:hypothetical protein GCM10010104_27530 [Streptomyces indiaensis]|uniref:Uncharacterized protein n=1 Tax=Streptomyces indiaensis TaxID=284033 RepID=A0ABP5QFV8_9ACTN
MVSGARLGPAQASRGTAGGQDGGGEGGGAACVRLTITSPTPAAGSPATASNAGTSVGFK